MEAQFTTTQQNTRHFLCPVCMKHYTVSEQSSIMISREDGKQITHNQVSLKSPVLLLCDCKDIYDDLYDGSTECFECDSHMVNHIIKLNTKGYKTWFCCEGHFDFVPYENPNRKDKKFEYSVSIPYISVDVNCIDEIMKVIDSYRKLRYWCIEPNYSYDLEKHCIDRSTPTSYSITINNNRFINIVEDRLGFSLSGKRFKEDGNDIEFLNMVKRNFESLKASYMHELGSIIEKLPDMNNIRGET